MEKKGMGEKVVEFAQCTVKLKAFRYDYPISSELREVIVGQVFRDFMKFAYDRYYSGYLPMLKKFGNGHQVREEKQEALKQNIFWWRLLYDASQNPARNCVKDFIAENYYSLKEKPFIISWLKEWEKVIPKFYFVGHKYHDRVLIVKDILTKETLSVLIYDPLALPPKTGEIAAGILMPLGAGEYFPIVDFYHFDYKPRIEIAKYLHFYYRKNSSMHEAFIHIFSALLQIEKDCLLRK